MTGWIAVSRKLWRHDFFKDSPMSEREAWLWMVAQAAYEDTHQDVFGVRYSVPRGSFMTTLRDMQSTFMWQSEKRVRTFLNRLENGRMVGRKLAAGKGGRKTHVTICNYEQFQGIGRKVGRMEGRTVDASRGEQKEQGLTNNNTSPYGEDGEAVDFTKQVFDRGVSFLGRHGTAEKQARSLIGKWRKQAGDTETFNALRDASRAGITDPVPWIIARLSADDASKNFKPTYDPQAVEGY